MNTFVVGLPENSFVTNCVIAAHRYISFKEYLRTDNEGVYLEWVDGKIEAFAVNNLTHQLTVGFLLTVLQLYAETHNLGEAVPPGYPMFLAHQKRGRVPDILFVAKNKRNLLTHDFLDGAARILIC